MFVCVQIREVGMSNPLVPFLALTLTLTAGVPTTGVARELQQERLFAIVPVSGDADLNVQKIVEIDTRPSSLGLVLREWPLTVEPPEAVRGGMHVVGTGRYVVWVSGVRTWYVYPVPRGLTRLNVFDTLSGT